MRDVGWQSVSAEKLPVSLTARTALLSRAKSGTRSKRDWSSPGRKEPDLHAEVVDRQSVLAWGEHDGYKHRTWEQPK